MEAYIPFLTMAVQTIIFGMGVYAVIIRNDANVMGLKTEMVEIKDQIKIMSDIVIKQAVQNVRLDSMSERITLQDRLIDDLRRGRGFVRENLDVEYGRG